MEDEATTRSNHSDRVVRVIQVFESGKVSHRDVTHTAKHLTPWGHGAGWGRGNAHAEPVRVKDPKKVAAGKARAEQARKQREAAEKATKAKRKAAKPKAKAPSPFPTVAKPKVAPAPKLAPAPKRTDADRMRVYAFRIRQDQHDKLHKLGRIGPELLRDAIDRM